ncbi:MAG: hypothetical protein U1F67_20685 [Rubrivivax sp.]
MNIDDTRRRFKGRGLLLPLVGSVIAGVALAQAPASEGAASAAAPPAAGTRAADNVRAVERCEASVAETLRKLRGNAADDVQFTPAQRSVAPADEGDVGVKGGGRYRGRGGAGALHLRLPTTPAAVSPRLSCCAKPARRPTAGARQTWQPDLSRVSPEGLRERRPRSCSLRSTSRVARTRDGAGHAPPAARARRAPAAAGPRRLGSAPRA